MTVYKYDKELGKVVEWTPPPPSEAPFHLMPEFQEYKAVGVDGRIVMSRSEHKRILKERGLVEVGNETPGWLKEQRYREKHEGKKDG
jgi:hypothetical protein